MIAVLLLLAIIAMANQTQVVRLSEYEVKDRSTLFALVGSLFLAGSSVAHAVEEVIYTFDEDDAQSALDSSGNSRDGLPQNLQVIDGVCGKGR